LPRPAPAAPADAVHTLDAEDPRPRPRPLRLDAGELRTVGGEQVIDEQGVHTVADPEDARTADAGNRDHVLRGERVVRVRRTGPARVAEDPRARPRPRRLGAGELRTVGVEQVIDEQVVHTVADPEDAWTADAGNSDHFLRGELVVQVRRTDNAVIGVFSARYALSVRPEDHEPALDIAESAAGPGVRGGRGTRHPTTRRELLRRMEEAGFVVTAGSTHGRVSHPDHPGLF